MRRLSLPFSVAAAAATAVVLLPVAMLRAAPPAAATASGARFVAVQGRLLDTRSASHVGPYRTPMGRNTWRSVPVTGHSGVPSAGVAAVTVTFTVVAPTGSGLIHADAGGAVRPNTAVTYLNYVRGGIQSNTAVVPVGANGAIQVETTTAVQLIVDLQGYYTAGTGTGGYVPVGGSRIVDTRTGLGTRKAPVAANAALTIRVPASSGILVGARAAMVAFTVLPRSRAAGFLTPYAAGSRVPSTSLNFPATTAPTALGAQVPLSRSGAFAVKVHGPAVDLVVDVVGYFAADEAGSTFSPGATRVLDSRVRPQTAVPPGGTVAVPVAGVGGVPSMSRGLTAVATNTAVVVSGRHSGYLRTWAEGSREPATSSLNFTGGVTANMMTLAVGADGAVNVFNGSAVPINVVIDVEGWYTATPATQPAGVFGGLDMHDGTIVHDAGTYYMYGTQYECGFTWMVRNTPFCGFAVRTAKSLSGPWSTPRLLFSPSATAHAGGWTGDNGKTWNWICGSNGGGCFNPRMVRRPDGVWVLWFNAPGDYFRNNQVNAYWAMGCRGPAGPCGSAAGAPHGSEHKPALVPCADDGDFSIVTSGAVAAIVCSEGYVSEEALTPSWTDGTGSGVHNIPLTGGTTAEGVGIFQVDDGTWEMTYSDPQCGYCSGPPNPSSAGGATEVHAGYATAPGMLGPWTAHGDLSLDYCTGQPRTVFAADGENWEWLDRWTGARNETEAAIKIEPMNAAPWSCA